MLIIVNIAIIYIATKFERSQKDINTKGRTIANRKKSEMTRTILIITFLYIILSLPGTIQTGYVYEDILKLQIDLANFIINILNGLQFSFQAFNFFILYFSNRLFSQEVKRILLNLKSSNQVLRTTGTTGGKSKTNASTHVKLAGQNVNSETADN